MHPFLHSLAVDCILFGRSASTFDLYFVLLLHQMGCRRGRVDAFARGLCRPTNAGGNTQHIGRECYQVQSTDKNFMVPVGGAIVAGPSSTLVDKAGEVEKCEEVERRCLTELQNKGLEPLSWPCINGPSASDSS